MELDLSEIRIPLLALAVTPAPGKPWVAGLCLYPGGR